MSDFAALNTALSGLLAYRRASETIGHNIANVNTEGYSRNRLDLLSAGSGAVPAVFMRPRETGEGVRVGDLLRIRDEFLERRFLNERAASDGLTRTEDVLRRAEITFPEPGPNGLSAQLGDFWSAWDDVANTPSSLGARAQLLERATTVIQTIKRSAQDLVNIGAAGVQQADAIVSEVNGHLARIAQLNGAIRAAVGAGLQPNDLLDQRDLLVEKVAGFVGATVKGGDFGTVDVSVGGMPLVWGDQYSELKVVAQVPSSGLASTLQWSNLVVQRKSDSQVVSLTGGEVYGLQQGVNASLPTYLDQLNTVATKLATVVNTIHRTGYGLTDTTAPNRDFFAFDTTQPNAALGLQLSSDLAEGNPSRVQNVAAADGPGRLDGSVAKQLAEAFADPAGPDQAYRGLIGALAVESQTVQRRSSIQDEITTQVETERKAVSGVNIDEEMVNLTMTQHAYSASARLMTTIDEMITTLINMAQ